MERGARNLWGEPEVFAAGGKTALVGSFSSGVGLSRLPTCPFSGPGTRTPGFHSPPLPFSIQASFHLPFVVSYLPRPALFGPYDRFRVALLLSRL